MQLLMELDVNSVGAAKSGGGQGTAYGGSSGNSNAGGDLSTNNVMASAVSGDAAGEDEGEVRAAESEPWSLFPSPIQSPSKQMLFWVHALELYTASGTVSPKRQR